MLHNALYGRWIPVTARARIRLSNGPMVSSDFQSNHREVSKPVARRYYVKFGRCGQGEENSSDATRANPVMRRSRHYSKCLDGRTCPIGDCSLAGGRLVFLRASRASGVGRFNEKLGHDSPKTWRMNRPSACPRSPSRGARRWCTPNSRAPRRR
jgi:hypothetical protein